MSKHEDRIVELAGGLLAPGEEIVSALVVSPRGSSTAAAPGLAPGEIGRRWSNKNKAAAERSASWSSAARASRSRTGVCSRWISRSRSRARIKEVKGMLSEVPLERGRRSQEQVERAHDQRRRVTVQARVQAPGRKGVRERIRCRESARVTVGIAHWLFLMITYWTFTVVQSGAYGPQHMVARARSGRLVRTSFPSEIQDGVE